MNAFDYSFKLFRIAGIDVRIHLLFVLLIGFELLSSGKYGLQFTATWLAILFGTVLLHEFGHCFGARAVGGYADDILLWPLGGLAFAHAPMKPWPQFVTVVCGPLVNVLICVLLAPVLWLLLDGMSWRVLVDFYAWPLVYADSPYWQLCLVLAYKVSYALLLFNLLPLYPMDGGQLLRAILWPHMGLNPATALTAQVGVVGGIMLGIYGILGGNFFMVGIAVIGVVESFQMYQLARQGYLREEPWVFVQPKWKEAEPGIFARAWNWLRGLMRRRPRIARHNADFDEPREEPATRENSDWLESEVDRILKKVHDQGMHSLTYVEKQTLERATRQRQERR